MHWYEVALWRRWPCESADFPAHVGRVLAPSACAAIAALMWRHGLLHVAYAAAGSCEHGCIVRCVAPSLGNVVGGVLPLRLSVNRRHDGSCVEQCRK